MYKLSALAVFCCLGLSGCAATAEAIGGLFHRDKKSDAEVALNIKTPDDRIKEWQLLAKTAKKKTPAEQQEISASLAKEIQHENDPYMRRQILHTLAAFPTPMAAAVIVAGLAETDTETRRVCCICLGKRGGKESVDELARVVTSDTNIDVRLAAVRALGKTRDKSAVVPLTEALVDPDPALQTIAVESLTNISGRHFGNNLDAWREYAKTGKSEADEISLAQRIRRSIF